MNFEHFGGIIISAKSIGNDVIIRQNTTLGVARADDTDARPTIEDGADIGVGVCILGDVTVGAGAVIGANAVVVRDVPPRSVAVGIPAKVIKTLDAAENTGADAASTSDSGGGS